MRPARFSFHALAALGAAACGGGPQLPPPPTPMPLPVQLYYDDNAGIRDSLRVIIRDAPTLARYWQDATSTQTSPPPAPAIDFARDMVILAAAGRMYPEDQIRIDSLFVREEPSEEARNVETLIILVRTSEGCRRFRTEAFPVHVVRARSFTGRVRWEERRQRPTDCRDAP